MTSNTNTPSEDQRLERSLGNSKPENQVGNLKDNTVLNLSHETTGSVASEISRLAEPHPTQILGRLKSKLAIQVAGSDEDRKESARRMLRDEKLMRDLTGHAPINIDPTAVEELIPFDQEDKGC